MARLIKRYGSRKLYDLRDSRYVSLEEIAARIRDGEEVRVVEASTGDDLTALALTQLLHDEERRGVSPLTPQFLHAVVRGGRMLGRSASAVRDRSLRRIRSELDLLRSHLDILARSLDDLEGSGPGHTAPPSFSARKRTRSRTRPAG
jgi:polyhydroxyalkanoate synthesis repressor PhaR